MRTFIKTVTLFSAIVGIGLGLTLSQGRAQTTRPAKKVKHVPGEYHATASMVQTTRQRGVLSLRAKFIVSKPQDPKVTGDVAAVAALNIRDLETGRLLVGMLPIGTVTDRAGVGNWHKSFDWSSPMPKGRYMVEFLVHDPKKVTTELDGTNGPYLLSGCTRRMTVE
jgi:hypothetical protein